MWRSCSTLDSGFTWPGGIRPQRAVRCGEICWVGGQVDLDARGSAAHPGDLHGQIAGAMVNVSSVLAQVGASTDSLVKLLCFYVSDGSVDEASVLGSIAAALPPGVRLAITAIPVPYAVLPGVLVEIEGYAMAGPDGQPLPRRCARTSSPAPASPLFVSAVRCGKMIFVSGQSPINGDNRIVMPGRIVDQTRHVMPLIARTLADLGASLQDAVKLNRWYVGHGTVDDFEPAALACASFFREPGPAATGIPIPVLARAGQQIKIELVAMLGEDDQPLPRRYSWPDSLWDWHVHLPYKHGLECAGMIFLGGQVALDKHGTAVSPKDLHAQTQIAMTHIGSILRDLGADYGDTCKLTTMYESSGAVEVLVGMTRVAQSFFSADPPAATSVALPKLAYPDMVIEIDAFAMMHPKHE